MAKNRLHKIISRVVEIRPGEEIIVLFFFFYFFLITAPHTIIKSLRNANFLDTLGPLKLPFAYLLVALVIGFVVAFHSKLQVKIQRHILIISSLIFFILTCFIFWLLLPGGTTTMSVAEHSATENYADTASAAYSSTINYQVIVAASLNPSHSDVSRIGDWTTGLSHRVGGTNNTNRLLIFVTGFENDSDTAITGVKYGEQAMTAAVQHVTTAGGGKVRCEIWHLNEVGIQSATGTTFDITYGARAPSNPMYAAVAFEGVNQVNPIHHYKKEQSSAGYNPNVDPIKARVNVVKGGMAIAGSVCGKGGTYSWGSGWIKSTDQSVGGWVPLIFWIWANIFIFVLNVQFWLSVNDVFNPREAKRLIGFFVSGGILGGVIGGLLAGFLAKIKLSDALLPIVCFMLIGCILIVRYKFIWQRKKQPTVEKEDKKSKRIKEEPQKVGFKVCFDTVKDHYYLKLLAAVMAITLVVSTLIDFQFNSVIKVKILGLDNLISFYGFFNAGLLVLPFFLQLFFTSNLIKRYGIRFSLLLFPLILLICSLGIGLLPLLVPASIMYFAIFIKGSDKSFSFSLNQSVRELLYIPVSPELKDKAKIFIDMFLNRFSRALGAVILLILTTLAANIFGKSIEENITEYISLVSGVTFIFIIAWVFLNLKVSKEYTNTLKQKLEVKWERADKEVAEKMDLDYTKLIFDTIESKNRSSVLYAMHLFDLIKQDKLSPEIKKLISYKSNEVRASSLAGLIGSEDTTIFLETDDFIDEEVLEKEIEEIMSLDVYQDVMKSYIEKTLSDKSMDSETAKMELAKAIGLMDFHSPLTQKLEELLQDESPEVAKYALESAAKIKKKEHVPALIKKLSSPITREDASTALEKYGHKVVGTLADYLGDTDEDIELRKGVSSVLARIGTQDAADFLSWELAEAKGDMDNELIDALDRIRSGKSDIQFQKGVIEANISEEIKSYCQIFIELFNLKTKGKKEEEEENLKRNLTNSMMNVFKLLGLIYSYEDITKAYQNIRTGTKNSVAYAIELLDNILEKDMRDIVFPLVEDLPPEERVKRCLDLLKNSSNL